MIRCGDPSDHAGHLWELWLTIPPGSQPPFVEWAYCDGLP